MHREHSKQDDQYIDQDNNNYANNDSTVQQQKLLHHEKQINVHNLFDKMTLEQNDELYRLYNYSTNQKQKQFKQQNNRFSYNKNDVEEQKGNKQSSKGIVQEIHEQHNWQRVANTNNTTNNNSSGESIVICCGYFVQYFVDKTQLINLLYIISSANVLHGVSETEVQRWLVMQPFMQHINFTFPQLCAVLDVVCRRVHFSQLLRCLCVTSSSPSLQQNKFQAKQQKVNVLSLFARATLATLPYTTGQLKQQKIDVMKNENLKDDARHEGVHNVTKTTATTTTNIQQMKNSHKQQITQNCNNNNYSRSKWTSTQDPIQEQLKKLVQAHQRRVNGGHVLCANCDYMKQEYKEQTKRNQTLQTKVQTLQMQIQQLTSQLQCKCSTLQSVQENLTETKRLLADAQLRQAELYDLLDKDHHTQLISSSSSSSSLHRKGKTDQKAKAALQIQITQKLQRINAHGDQYNHHINDNKAQNISQGSNMSETIAEVNQVNSNRHNEYDDNNNNNTMDESMQHSNHYGKEDANKVACQLRRDKLNNDSPAENLFDAVCPI